MTGIPLVNSNSVNDINTSIIAIKKEMKSSGETEVNVNVNLPDTAIPVDEVTSGNMHSVTSNAVASALSYSTSEVNTGKKWIDGKPIYRKTVICSISSYASTAHNISNLNEITKIEAKSVSNNGETRPIPFIYFGSMDWACGVTVNNTNIAIEAGSSFSAVHTTATVTLEYTKSN